MGRILLIFMAFMTSLSLSAQGELSFSTERGFFNGPINLEITTDLPAASILFTTDGTDPLVFGTQYQSAISINTTTTVTALAINNTDTLDQVTHSYFYYDDILTQSGILDTFDVALSDSVLADATLQNDFLASFNQIPTVSIVLPEDSMFGTQRGIYANPIANGRDWERFTSFEIMKPVGDDIQVNAGIRIHGATTRNYRKKSFRMYFRSDYGPGRLNYDLYDNPEATDRFDHLVLHQGGHQDTFVGFRKEKATYSKNRYANELLLDMDQVTSHGRYAHLFINGYYWGLYNILERPRAEFFEEYLGGDENDYDVVKGENLITPEFSDGTGDFWNEMLTVIEQGVETDADLEAVSQYINLESFLDYMILSQTLGNRDWDNHNWIAARNAKKNEPFIFLNWDSDAIWDGINREDDLSAFHYYKNYKYMPTWILRQLQRAPAFQCMMQDRINLRLENNGILSPAHMQSVFDEIKFEMRDAIKGEAARWGNVNFLNLYEERSIYIRDTFLLSRTDSVLNFYDQYEAYQNDFDKPQFSFTGGFITAGQTVDINSNETVFYTLDGSDPKSEDGVSSTANIYAAPITLNNTTVLKARSVRNIPFCNVAKYKPVMQSGLANNDLLSAHFASRANDGIIEDRSMWNIYGGSIAATDTITEPWWEIDLQETVNITDLKIHSPNCCITGLGPHVIFLSDNPIPVGTVAQTISLAGVTALFQTGNCGQHCIIPVNQQARYIRIQSTETNTSIRLAEVEVFQNNCTEWSVLREAHYYINQNYADLIFNEIHYNPTDSINTIDTLDGDQYEFIEFYNSGNTNIELSGLFLSGGIEFNFPFGSVIGPGAYLVLAEDSISFIDRYGFSPFGTYTGKLSNGGEQIELRNPLGSLINQINYDDAAPWVIEPDGTGPSLALLPNQNNINVASAWAVQFDPLTPGEENNFCFPFVINDFANDITCNGEDDGFIILIASGGNAPLTYNWSDGSTTANISNLSAGNYTVQISDAYNCSEGRNYTITEPSPLSVSVNQQNESVAGANDGSATASVSGASPPYSYLWSTGATSTSVNNLSPGNYTLEITDNNDCVELISFVILPGNPACAVVNDLSVSNIQETSAILIWTANPSAQSYEVQYRETESVNWNSFNANNSFAILSGLMACTDYEIRIKTTCVTGLSDWSAISTFQTAGCASPCTSLVGLFSHNITSSSAILVWDLVPDASYNLYYRETSAANWNTYTTPYPLAILFNLPACTPFEWYVEVICTNGQISNPSIIANFSTTGSTCRLADSKIAESEKLFKLFPNPASHFIELQSEEEIEFFEIYNVQGKIVNEGELHPSTQNKKINISHFSKGVYFIRIQIEDTVQQVSFIKN